METEQLLLSLQAVTKLIESRDNIKEILDLAVTGEQEQAEETMRTFIMALYMDGFNDGLLYAAEKIEDKLRGV